MPADHFRTIAAAAESRQKIERSEFLGIALPVTTEDAFFAELSRIQKQHFDATHHCWALRLFDGGAVRQRSADAGEPSGTAGKPILSAIDGAEVHDVAVVVVRWYGGVKLGSGGLTRAYREAAANALAASAPLDRYLYERFTVTVPFDVMNIAYRLVDQPAVILAGEEFGEQNAFRFDVRLSHAESFALLLTERRFAFTRDPTPRLR